MVMAIGVSSVAAFDSVIATYSTVFFLETVGMDGIDFGNIQLVSKLWDAILDPIVVTTFIITVLIITRSYA
ncbi:MAG: hypothetical protein ORN24_00695, partial [Burkholderiales bacterium]|nr:hypothetical protein [Burkholderiales bacterium]